MDSRNESRLSILHSNTKHSSKSSLIEEENYDVCIPRLVGDERRLKQVLLKLVKNAEKFTTNGYIKIKANYDDRHDDLIVSVEDTGAGISQEDIPNLFNRFGKLHRTAEINSEGIGLGLTIVKQIIEKSGGTIGAWSKGIGHGSVFYFNMKMKTALNTL